MNGTGRNGASKELLRACLFCAEFNAYCTYQEAASDTHVERVINDKTWQKLGACAVGHLFGPQRDPIVWDAQE